MIGTDPLSWQTLARVVEENRAALSQDWMVPFDRFLAVALVCFADAGVEVVILEAGIGGLLDSTNYVDRPSAVCIMSIGLDHCELLGTSIEQVARQKAGIIKPCCDVFTPSTQCAKALGVLENTARSNDVTLHKTAASKAPLLLSKPSCYADNAGVAEAVVSYLGLDARCTDIQTRAGRFEEIVLNVSPTRGQGAMADNHFMFNENTSGSPPTILLDGAHNEGAVSLLLDETRRLFPGRILRVVFGTNLDKQFGAMGRLVCGVAQSVVFVASSHPSAAPPHALQVS